MDNNTYGSMGEGGMHRTSSEFEDRKPDLSQDDIKNGVGSTGRRAYRACAHCRSRKAKCDLGDIDAPRDPPCSRCKRESRECTFLPSRRGGNLAKRADDPSSTTNNNLDTDTFDDSDGRKRRRSSFSQAGDGDLVGGFDFGGPTGGLNAAWPLEEPPLDPRGLAPSSSASTNASLPRPPRQNNTVYGQPPTVSSTQSLLDSLTRPADGRLPQPQPGMPSTYADAIPMFDSLYHSAYPPGPHPQPYMPPQPSKTVPSGPTTSASSSGSHATHPHRPLSHTQQNPAAFSPPSANPSTNRQLGETQPRAGPSRAKEAIVGASPPPQASSSTHPRPLQPPAASQPKPKSHRSTTTHDPESFVTAGMANEADALSLLALTATGNNRTGAGGTGKSPTSEHVATPSTSKSLGASSAYQPSAEGALGPDQRGEGAESNKGDSDEEPEAEVVPPLAEYDLLQQKVLTKPLLVKYVDQFFLRHHQLFPMVPSYRIPKTEAQLAHFAWKDKELLTAFVVIASRFDQENKQVHEEAWRVMSRYIAAVVVHGQEAQVGFVEACLLLSENLPRQNQNDVLLPMPNNSRPWDDSAQSWHLVGHAVRTGYYLGLDQKTLYVDPKMPTTPELDRERLAWTYCYLFDRHISLRLGKAFWSRGPGLCFTPNDAQANFPSLRPIEGEQDDFASVVQALIELTQSMTNSHDVLYPSKDRTISLVRAGEYYRYLDEFTRSINAFRDLWTPVQFNTFPTSEIVWCTYQYLRLYIYSFAFQAHVQRAAALGADTHSGGGALFPRGLTQSPDAKFIFESIDSARQLLELCTERLHPGGALPYLPNRVILWFTFGTVFLLKAIYSGAVLQADTKPIVEQIQKVIFCLGASSPDRAHIGIRHALLLRTVAKKLRQSFSDDAWVSHTGTVSPIITFPGSPRQHHHPPIPNPPTSNPTTTTTTTNPSQPFPSPSPNPNTSWPDYSHATFNAQATAHQPPPPNLSNPFADFTSTDFPSAPFLSDPPGGAGGAGWSGEFDDLLGGVGGLGGGDGGAEDFFSLSNSDFWANLAVPGSGLPFR